MPPVDGTVIPPAAMIGCLPPVSVLLAGGEVVAVRGHVDKRVAFAGFVGVLASYESIDSAAAFLDRYNADDLMHRWAIDVPAGDDPDGLHHVTFAADPAQLAAGEAYPVTVLDKRPDPDLQD